MKRSKKGFIGDIPLIIGFLFLFAVVIIVGYQFLSAYNTKYQAANVSQGSKDLVQSSKDRYVGLFDGIMGFVFALLVIALFVSLTLIPSNPAFFFITVILLVILIGAGAVFSNSYEQIANDSHISTTASEFTFTPFLMSNLPTVILFMGCVFIIGLYMKLRGVF